LLRQVGGLLRARVSPYGSHNGIGAVQSGEEMTRKKSKNKSPAPKGSSISASVLFILLSVLMLLCRSIPNPICNRLKIQLEIRFVFLEENRGNPRNNNYKIVLQPTGEVEVDVTALANYCASEVSIDLSLRPIQASDIAPKYGAAQRCDIFCTIKTIILVYFRPTKL
jgi:hypothetical protein